MTIASFSGTFPGQRGKEEGLAWEYGHDYIPVQQWNWYEQITGVTSGQVIVSPGVTLLSGGLTLQLTSGVVGLLSEASGEAFDFCWKVRGNVDCSKDFLVSLDFTTNAAVNHIRSDSGITHFTLSYRAETPNAGTFLSGLAFTATQSADVNWSAQTWSGVLAASGLGALLSTECALLSGYVSGLPAEGTKFKNYDRVTFRVTNRLTSGAAGIGVVFLGANIFYPRKLI